MEKLDYIDIAKGIGIVLVVIGHYYPDNSPLFYETFRAFVYAFHMPLFLFLSGAMYAYTKKNESWSAFMRKKMKRIAVPYLIVSILIIGLKLIMQNGAYVENGVDAYSFVRMFYLPEAGYFLWYLWVLLWMYLLCSISDSRCYFYVLLILSLIFKFLPYEFSRLFCLHELKSSAIYFMLGALFFRENIYFLFRNVYLQVLFIVSLFVFALLWFKGWSHPNFAISLIGTLGVISLSNLIEKRKNSKLLFLGKSSFIIYLFHTTFMGFAKSLVHRFSETLFVENNGYFLITLVSVSLIGILFPLLLQEYIISKSNTIGSLFGYKKKNNENTSLK
ncbi:MAG: acyltransferase family protein [Paludibacteraceae bacterium]|nr:acyltransferase family protein [Paludibacteraceae bacterium]